LVDTNSNPRDVDYAIPANDDASKSIHKVMSYMTDSILEGLNERKDGKDSAEEKPAKAKKEASADEKPAKAEKKAVVEETPEDKVKEETNTEAKPAKAEKKAPVVEEAPTDKAEPKKPAGEENKASE
jgi:small subunit ribosomal protein S2